MIHYQESFDLLRRAGYPRCFSCAFHYIQQGNEIIKTALNAIDNHYHLMLFWPRLSKTAKLPAFIKRVT
ncbi:MAG: hypothetical protein CMP91_08265 [Gammaproteobacteria bacterium]|nr:hypothetical protein [Gammaproteobacteria bacterium]MAY03610.1 hypothetical protein [Gammaproteobacteria bacterium]